VTLAQAIVVSSVFSVTEISPLKSTNFTTHFSISPLGHKAY
jgi:hypothetical protein